MEIVVAVGEALLSAAVQPLIERLTSHELNNFVRQEKIDADINDWKIILAEINALLNDAEDAQMKNSAVKIWLDEFRDLTYDIEDVLDEFNTEAMKRDMMEDPQVSTSKLQKFIHTCFTSSVFKNKMASRIKHITERLERIKARQEQTLNLRRITDGTRSNQLKKRPPTTSLVVESHIYGRGDEKEAIVQKLLRDEGSNNPISVIPILGMGGIGKTTLAQLVYNDSAVKDYFDIKMWVCVSENFDVVGLTRTILRKVDPGARDLNNLDLDSLQETLKGKLSQKKFLLVLDDVWEEDYNLWEELRKPFISAASNSKIIVTTRKNNAAPITGDVHVYRVKELPDDECLLLLACHALGANSFNARLDLKDIGEELVKRCNGLPLAAKVLGGLLRNKPCREQWERVLKNKWWNFPKTSNSVHPTLKLSYDDLPSHLKRCFVYCAILPKDYEFDRHELVRLWMAEGFLHHPHGGKHMEDLGIEYFEDLVSRCFFGPRNIKWSSKLSFVMHDLISDLAQTIAGDICYNYENKTEVDMSSSKYENVRHASFSFGQDSQEYEVYSRMKKLRTIWRRGDPYRQRGVSGNKMLEELSTHSKCVRVLSLAHFPITPLSNSIGDLKLLRFMDLSRTNIQRLPELVSTLFNLQTLLLRFCSKLEKLPDKIGGLANLLHLDIYDTQKLQKLPSSIGMLTNLQTLSKFIVKEGDGTTIAELKNLNNLRGSLSIEGLENVEDAKLANLKGKQGLEELELKWSTGHGRNDMSVLESLEPPHQNLKRLTISCYCGAQFPSWMSNTRLFSKLVFLLLRECRETKVLPPLGQLCSLKELRIEGLKAVKSIGVEFYGNAAVPFPSLERLEIDGMPEWSEWSHCNMGGDQGFPNLQNLYLSDCPKLIGSLPSGLHRLQHLSELDIIQCENFVSFAPMGLPRCLKRIYVEYCDALECFPIIGTRDGRESLLEELEIEDCSSLKHFERNFKLPTSLRKLKILNCGNLLSLPNGLMVQEYNTRQSKSESHLEELEIVGCQALTSIPAGKFPAALKIIHVGDCSAFECFPIIDTRDGRESLLEELEIEFCSSLKHFERNFKLPTSLRKLIIFNCRNLLSLPDGLMVQDDNTRQSESESHLEELEIVGCQALTSIPAGKFPAALKILKIEGPICMQLVSFPGMGLSHCLKIIHVRYCDTLECFPTINPRDGRESLLEELEIEDCSSLKYFEGNFKLPTSLRKLIIRNCGNLLSLPDGLMVQDDNTRQSESESHLEELEIVGCQALTSIPAGKLPAALKILKIRGPICMQLGCQGLTSFPAGKFPAALKIIHVSRCAFECFPIIDTRDGRESVLEELEIEDCSSLKHFERNFKLPTSLRKLKITNCDNLLSLPDGLMVQDDNTNQSDQSQSHLEHLKIYRCDRLTTLPTGKFPAALKTLEIGGPICMLLESAISENTSALETITISHNDDIKAFPSTDCFPSLKCLQIEECQNLLLLPIRMQSHFPSLQTLIIGGCPNVGSLIEDGGLPRNLTMELCENMRPPIPIAEWGLGMLSSLHILHVYGRCPATADVVSFPDDNCCWLPTSLTYLIISDFVSLESVSMGLRMLTSLNYLSIGDCPKLRSLPKDALPSSLKHVRIKGCPILRAHYLENRGEYSSIVVFLD